MSHEDSSGSFTARNTPRTGMSDTPCREPQSYSPVLLTFLAAQSTPDLQKTHESNYSTTPQGLFEYAVANAVVPASRDELYRPMDIRTKMSWKYVQMKKREEVSE